MAQIALRVVERARSGPRLMQALRRPVGQGLAPMGPGVAGLASIATAAYSAGAQTGLPTSPALTHMR